MIERFTTISHLSFDNLLKLKESKETKNILMKLEYYSLLLKYFKVRFKNNFSLNYLDWLI